MKIITIIIITLFLFVNLQSQDKNCILQFGTNLGGLADWGTELPFVDMMKNAREWYTKDVGNPNGLFNSEAADSMSFRDDGYPTHIPQTVEGRTFMQSVATIWAVTDGWKAGSYTIFYDGTGKLSFWGSLTNVQYVNKGKITFDLNQPKGGILELRIDTSLINDPIRNIRVIIGGNEDTYQTKPFNPLWIEKLSAFKSVRFMDWGHTNNWGKNESWEFDDTTLNKWDDRSKMEHYTWAYNKGIPYEMMIKLMNDYDLDGWVCVPHRTSNEFIQKMAELFRDSLETGRKLTVEYSNEVWNWMFGQTHWLNKYGCVEKNIYWPEGIVPYIQNCMDIWTEIFDGQLNRIVRAVGVQTAWLDVSQRIVFNMDSSSFDAVSPAYYFGLSSEADEILDAKGTNATVSDVASLVRQWREINEKKWIKDIKEKVADTINKKIIFYEGGQHITPTPFGQEPTYAQALLDIQRDTSIYNLYVEWYDFLKTLQKGEEPIQLMNFSFIGQRSARYGSWGILETMDQDTSQIPAPKYRATIEANCFNNCQREIFVDDSFNWQTDGWGITHFSDLSKGMAHACTDATIYISTEGITTFTGDVSFDGLKVILGNHDFELTGNITNGLIKTINSGKLVIKAIKANVTSRFPITDGINDYSITFNTSSNSEPDISINIVNKNINNTMTSNFVSIQGPSNLGATITIRIDKSAIAPKIISSTTNLRYFSVTQNKYIPFCGENVNIEEESDYYFITIKNVNEF